MKTSNAILPALCCLLAFGLSGASAQDAAPADPGAPRFDRAVMDSCLEHARAQQDGGDPAACIGLASDKCMEEPGGFSTAGMANCLGQERFYWDARLNADYAKVMANAEAADAELKALDSAIPGQAPVLRQMQRDWIAYRDSSCLWEEAQWQGGTGGIVAASACAMRLTAQQALRLEQALQRDQ